MFLFLLAFCLYFSWGGFFSSADGKEAQKATGLEESPEWRAFLNRRQEIENDPTLDESSRKTLIENWQLMAGESKPHMSPDVHVPLARFNWAKPAALPVLIGGSLVLAGLFTFSIGAFHPAAFQWSSPRLGNPEESGNTSTANPMSAGHPGDGVNLEERLAGLQARLAAQPDDLRGWVLLGRTHASMSNYSESARALKKALELAPGHPDILADIADMTAMAQGRQLAGEPEAYIQAALQSDPRHEKALALAASAAEQANNNSQAQVYWQLLSQVQQDKLKGASEATAGAITTVRVNIPQDALKQVKAGSMLFVYLKAQATSGMPLAVVKMPAVQLAAGTVDIPVGPDNFIQPDSLENLPATLHAQARLSIKGVAEPAAEDIESDWVAASASELSAGINLQLPAKPATP
ncbi:MAG TPA: hypothetical protein VFV28_03960 [Limnobacter sp.]|nr:hypothetical protein [Limnobacter sp.]